MKYVNLYLTNAKLYSMSFTNTPPTSSNDINLTEITKTGEYYTLTATSNSQSFFIIPNAEINKITPLNLDGPFEQLQMNTNKYYSDLNGFPLGLNPTVDTEGTEVDYITVNILEEDTDYLNKRGLKVFYDALQEKNLKLEFKDSDDFNIEKNSINLYDKYLIDERGKFILEHPDLMLESDFPISSSDSEEEFPSNWENYVIERGEDAENFPYPGMDDDVLQTWLNQLSMKQWKDIINMFLEQFPDGIETNSNINFLIDGVNYNFNYIWNASINPDNSDQFRIQIILPINSEQGWRFYLCGCEDGKTWNISRTSHAETRDTYSDRINYLITNTDIDTFSNSVMKWKEIIKVYFLIYDWMNAASSSSINWEEIYNNGVPKNNPNADYWWNGININWLYDLEYFSQFNTWFPYGLFIIDDKLYYFDKITIQDEYNIVHILPYPSNSLKNVIIFSDENNNIKMYSFGSNDEEDSNYVKKTGDTMTGNLNIVGGKSLNVGCEYNVTNSELSSLAIGGYEADPNGETDPHNSPFPVYALGASSVASGIKSIALGDGAVAVGIGAFAGDKGAHAEGYSWDWDIIKVTSYNYANKQYKVMPNENEQFGDIYEGNIVVYVDRYSQVRYATVTNVTYDETTGQPTFTTDANLERNSYSSQALNNSTVYVTSSGAVGQASHSEGGSTLALEYYAHAEGSGTRATGRMTHAEGSNTMASGERSHAEGNYTTSSGVSSHAEGGIGTNTIILTGAKNVTTYTTSDTSFIQIGDTISTTSSNNFPSSYSATVTSFVNNTSVTLNKTISSRAISNKTCYVYKKSDVSGESAHGEGGGTTASGKFSHAEGFKTTASGMATHGEGIGTTAQRRSQHTEGEYNILDSSGSITTRGTYLHIAGNGTSSTRSNAYTLDWSGNAWFAGDVYVGSTSGTNKDAGSKKLLTKDDIPVYTATEIETIWYNGETPSQILGGEY